MAKRKEKTLAEKVQEVRQALFDDPLVKNNWPTEDDLCLVMDDRVHDMADDEASNINNGGDLEGFATSRGVEVTEDMPDIEAFDVTHDLKSKDATDINNGGLDSQLEFLIGECDDTAESILEWLKEQV